MSQRLLNLIAPCGMNCGVCRAYLREKNKCPGCRLFNAKEPVSIARCKIKNCRWFQGANKRFCFTCKDFPCPPLKHLDKRYRTKYHMSMIENLGYIKEFGVRKFVAKEATRWACQGCGGIICVHRGTCVSCGKKQA